MSKHISIKTFNEAILKAENCYADLFHNSQTQTRMLHSCKCLLPMSIDSGEITKKKRILACNHKSVEFSALCCVFSPDKITFPNLCFLPPFSFYECGHSHRSSIDGEFYS